MTNFEQYVHELEDGRSLHCWINRPDSSSNISKVTIVTPGFGRRMHQHSSLCQYLVANGSAVVRFDSLDHIGLSDGDISEFTLSSAFDSLNAAVIAARSIFPDASYSLVATSLTARVALRYFVQDPLFDRLIAMSGIVNVGRTMSGVLGQDYTRWDEARLPKTDEFEGQTISIRPWYKDGHNQDWFSLDTTLTEIGLLSRRVHWFVGKDDDWVDRDDLQVSSAANPDNFQITWLDSCGHDIGRNAAAARVMMYRIVTLCIDGELSKREISQPGHSDLMTIALKERRIQREATTR